MSVILVRSVRFSPSSAPSLIVSSWDSSVRLYDCVGNSQRLRYNHERAVLDVCFLVSSMQKLIEYADDCVMYILIYWFSQEAMRSISGSLDGVLKMCDLNSGSGIFFRVKVAELFHLLDCTIFRFCDRHSSRHNSGS